MNAARQPRPTATAQQAALRLALVSLLFVTLYAACNHVTHLRGAVAAGVFAWEHRIPFVPWTVVPYLSIFGFFAASFAVDPDQRRLDRYCIALVANLLLALACYACVPLEFTFERPIPPGLFRPLFELLRAADLPYNRAPSLHISILVLLWWRLRPGLQTLGRVLVGGWFLLIGVSVLTTYQHHLIDIPAGLAAAAVSVALARRLAARRHDRRAARPQLAAASGSARTVSPSRIGPASSTRAVMPPCPRIAA